MRTIAGNGSGNPKLPLPETLSACKSNALTEGFKDIFSLTARGLYSLGTSRYYRPEQITLHRQTFIDGNENPAENATVYMIETTDGVRGTLTDPVSLPADPGVTRFFREVESIHQQMAAYGRHQC